MKKILTAALALAGFAIAAPNHITKSNYKDYTSWDKDSFSYYAFNKIKAQSAKCHKDYSNTKYCNVAAVNDIDLFAGPHLGTVYTYKHVSISPVTTVDKIRYDRDKTEFYYDGYGGVTHIAKYDSSFMKSDWARKGMPMSAKELNFTIDTVKSHYGTLQKDTTTLSAQYDTLKTSKHNYKNINKTKGYLYIPAGEFYLNSLTISKQVEVKLLNPRKATIIHVKNGATWTPKAYINKPNAGDPELYVDMPQNFLLINHGTKTITINDIKGTIIAPYSTINIKGFHDGNAIAKDITLESGSVAHQHYNKFNPTSW